MPILQDMLLLFDRLSKVCSEYEDFVGEGERLFTWTERAMVGATAIAADRAGWKSMQEYHGQTKDSKRWVDLWLMTKERRTYPIEAKFVFYPAHNCHQSSDKIHWEVKDKMIEAGVQFRDFMALDEDELVIILFAIPYFGKGQEIAPNWRADAEQYFESCLPKCAPQGFSLVTVKTYESTNQEVLKSRIGYKDSLTPGFVFCVLSQKYTPSNLCCPKP